MPAITVRRIPLADTRSYAAPSGLSRVRMTPNGVTMLAAVNGRGSYDDYHENGAKKHRRKAAKRTRKAARLRARARGKGVSATKRAKLYRKAKRKTKRAKRSTKKAGWHKQIKKLAHKAGMTRKQLIALIRERTGMTQAEAKAEVKDAIGSSGFSYTSPATAAYEGGSVSLPEPEFKGYGSSGSWHGGKDKRSKLSFNGRRDTMSANSLAGIKKYYRSISRHASKAEAKRALVKKFGSKLAREVLASEGGSSMAHKKSKKGRRKAGRRRATGYRSAARRKGRKAHRRAARRSHRGHRKGRKSGRRRMRRNGSDEYEANGSDEDDGDFAPNKKRGGKKKSKAKRKGSKKSIFGKKMLKMIDPLGQYRGPDPFAIMVLDRLANQARSGAISLDQYKALRKQIAKATFPSQKGSGKHVIPVEVTDPFSGKTKVVKVPWKGKVRTAFGPFKRRTKGGALTYEWEKGEHIPEWALVGGYSLDDALLMKERDPSFASEAAAIEARIQDLRSHDARRKTAEVDRKIEKLQKRLAKITSEGDVYTPNARGRGRRKSSRKGKRRMSAKQRAAFKKMIAAGKAARRGKGRRKSSRKGKRRSSKRRSSKRRSSKRSYKRNGRRGYGRRKARRSGKRRSHRGHRKGRKSGRSRSRRRSHRGHRKGRKHSRRRMRRNGLADLRADLPTAVAVTLGFVAQSALTSLLGGSVNPMLSFAGSYAPLLTSLGVAVVGSLLAHMIPDYGTPVAVGMLSSFAVDGVRTAVPSIPGLAGIPYINTSGWGSKRPLSAYELRGVGEYELRGLGATPQQALAAYELRGLGATPQQALAGGYAQALAGNPNYAQAMAAYELRGLGAEGILPSQADAALDMADQGGEADSLTYQGGEYVNTQLRPGLPTFWADPLADIGVPGDSGGGIPWKSIWNPDQSGIDPTGGIFDDPNTPLPPGRADIVSR